MKPEDHILFQHMFERIQRIERHMSDGLRDEKTLDSVERNLEIIGEAANNLSGEIKSQYPDIPWKDIIGTRHKLIHDYLGIRTKSIWDIVDEDLPVLKQKLTSILNEEKK